MVRTLTFSFYRIWACSSVMRALRLRKGSGRCSRRMLKQWKGRAEEQENEVREAHRKVDELERALRSAEQSGTVSLFETRTAELRDAQTYLTKLDGVADSDVLWLGERLNSNSNIYRTCANIASAFEREYRKVQEGEAFEQAYQRMASVGLFSPEMINALRCFAHQQDSVLVQAALQMAVVSYTRWVCGTWDFLQNSSTTLQNSYSRINQSGTYHPLDHTLFASSSLRALQKHRPWQEGGVR